MATRAFYIQQAKSCFDMAAMSRDAVVRARWIDRANEYLLLADAIGEDDLLPDAPPKADSAQQQPAQQQQQIQPNKEKK